ncbi:zinc ribbon domain-containing protein [Ruegeria atlantica]|uniref:zinc ribbon domain-containing protein n=1 Tax=Ruegeria atlantica TaxID=81569 RepID=UPI00147B175B|nr:zinc ribbon domain-containing protein [Ruegeria atlantica]
MAIVIKPDRKQKLYKRMKKHEDIFQVSSQINLFRGPGSLKQLCIFPVLSFLPLALLWVLHRTALTIPPKAVGILIAGTLLIGALCLTTPFIRRIRVDLEKSVSMGVHVSWGVLHRQNVHGIASRGVVVALFAPLMVAILASADYFLEGQFRVAYVPTLFFSILILMAAGSRAVGGKIPFLEFFLIGFSVFTLVGLNMWSANSWSWLSMLGSFERLLFGLVVVVISIPAQYFLGSTITHWFLSPTILNLPIRRSYPRKKLRVYNLIGFIEYLLVRQYDVMASSAIAISVLVYWLYSYSSSSLVFVFLSLAIYLPVVSASMLTGKRVQAAELRFVRRMAMQTSAVSIVSVNLLLPVAYSVGWLFFQAYVIVFGSFGGYPIPEMFYSFRTQSPLELPLLEQAEAAFVSVCILLAASWFLFILHTRSWREFVYLGASVGLAIVAPYLSLPEQFIETRLPITQQVPSVVLGLIIPAVRGFFVQDLEEGFVGSKVELTCDICGEQNLPPDARFCSMCGHVIDQ